MSSLLASDGDGGGSGSGSDGGGTITSTVRTLPMTDLNTIEKKKKETKVQTRAKVKSQKAMVINSAYSVDDTGEDVSLDAKDENKIDDILYRHPGMILYKCTQPGPEGDFDGDVAPHPPILAADEAVAEAHALLEYERILLGRKKKNVTLAPTPVLIKGNPLVHTDDAKSIPPTGFSSTLQHTPTTVATEPTTIATELTRP